MSNVGLKRPKESLDWKCTLEKDSFILNSLSKYRHVSTIEFSAGIAMDTQSGPEY